MRSEISSCFPTHDAMRLRHGWGTHILPGLRIKTWGTRTQILPGLKSETWGTQVVGNLSIRSASLRERSGWRWEWFSI